MPLPLERLLLQSSGLVIEITLDCDSSPGEPIPLLGSIGPILQRNKRLTSLWNQ